MILQIFQDDSVGERGVIHEWELKDNVSLESLRESITNVLNETDSIERQWNPTDGYIY